MNFNKDKVDDMTLALIFLGTSKTPGIPGARAWGGLNPQTLERLHQKGLIEDPKQKATSLHLTEEGYARSKQLFEEYFSK
ncbi:MAG: hypothetical protein JW969_17010 [Spirochaetales bacterium]|nr:hypothetical protein [Spirochaetales bacterium]